MKVGGCVVGFDDAFGPCRPAGAKSDHTGCDPCVVYLYAFLPTSLQNNRSQQPLLAHLSKQLTKTSQPKALVADKSRSPPRLANPTHCSAVEHTHTLRTRAPLQNEDSSAEHHHVGAGVLPPPGDCIVSGWP